MKKRNVFIFICILILMASMMCGSAFASGSAQASLSGGGEFNKGDTVSVTLTYSGDTFGSADVLFTYDSAVLEYSSCDGAVAFGGSGNVKATMSDVSNSSSLSCTLRFKAVKAGTTYITASTQTLYNFDEEELTAADTFVKATVKDASEEASGNAELISLMISGGNLSPSFNSNITSYTMSVPYDTTVCTISAKTDDDKAEYKITGSKELKVGTNVREIIVTAENGNTKTYTVTITRAGQSSGSDSDTQTTEPEQSENVENTENTENEDDVKENEDDGRLIVSIGEKKYIVVEDLTAVEIPDGFTQDIKKYNGKDVPVIVNEDGELVLVLLQNEADEKTCWYFFNEKKQTFSSKKSLTSEQILKYEGAMNQIEALNVDAETEKNAVDIDTVDVLLVALGATVALLLIVLIVLVVKKKK